jgi:hypothetical protein
MIYLRFMKIGSGVQAILRFCLRYLNGGNADITDLRDLSSVILILIKAFKQYHVLPQKFERL